VGADVSRSRSLVLQQNEDLRSIALRELGDASRWTEIAQMNGLRLPYLVPTWRSENRLPHTLIWGDSFLIPWPSNSTLPPTSTSTYGIDLAMNAGRLTADGDFDTIVGPENVIQALANRFRTLVGEISYHPSYGCNVSLALGLPAGPFAGLMASTWVTEALRAEPRVMVVHYVTATVRGDAVLIAGKITLVGDNKSTDLNLVLNP